MACYPALDVSNADDGLVLAIVDDYFPTAVEEHVGSLTIFFGSAAARSAAAAALVRAFPDVRLSRRDVEDEDWARRSQEDLTPITVGGVTVAPPWASPTASDLEVVVLPSMGFGTGHHATTRLCLLAMQTLNLRGAWVLDVGTGSGVLALAARRLGAAIVLGIDSDPDAIAAARDNLALNADVENVTFEIRSLEEFASRETYRKFDVAFANLTGTLLERQAPALSRLVRPGGTLVVSGLLCDERMTVARALASRPGAEIEWERREDEWVGLVVSVARLKT